MRLRCANPCCNQVLDMTREFKRVDGRVYCSTACVNEYLKQVGRFDYTTKTVQQGNPLNYKKPPS